MTKRNTLTFGALLAALCLTMTPSATAQGFFGISFEKHKRGKHFGFSLGIPFGNNHRRRPVRVYEPVRLPPRRHVHCGSCERVIPGHYEVVRERIRVPRFRKRWIPPVYGRRYDECGRPYRVVLRPGFFKRIPSGYRFKKVRRRVWVPARTEFVCGY